MTITLERDYDIARNEALGLTDDPDRVVEEIDPKKGSLSWQETQDICEIVCDKLCRFPYEYKDPDVMWAEQCNRCPLGEKLEEFENE